MDRRRVVITGMGTVNPLGNDCATSWEAVKKGVCGIGPITHFDTTDFKVKLAAEVKDFNPAPILGNKEARRMDRYTQLACVAAKEAILDSGLDMEKENADRCGCIVSSGIGGISTTVREHTKIMEKGYDMISPFFIPMAITNMAAGQIALTYGLKGICTCIVTACASANHAIGESFHRIRDGYEEVIVTGGAEASVMDMAIAGFQMMKALCRSDDPNRASIPFDKERNGFVMGEGGGILVLEEYDHAVKRGAKIYAEIVGYGANCDAYHITAPDPEGNGGAKCMSLAIEDAGLKPEDIDYINAHGTSTPLNDAGETLAIKKAFDEHAYKLMVSSTKSMTGHLLGGAGAVEAIFSAMAIKDGFVPATINYIEKDPACDLDIVPNEGRNIAIRTALSNSLGFGGHNASIILRKAE